MFKRKTSSLDERNEKRWGEGYEERKRERERDEGGGGRRCLHEEIEGE